MGVVAPTGIATDAFTQGLFNAMVDERSLVSLYDFENRLAVFPGVHRSYKFSLLTLSGTERPVDEAEFVFFALGVDDLDDPEKRFTLSPEDFELLNPNTRTCPVFRSSLDAEITKRVYRAHRVLVRGSDENRNPWGFKGQLMFMMNTDSHHFLTASDVTGATAGSRILLEGGSSLAALHEGKMGHQFDHRFRSFGAGEYRVVSPLEHSDPSFVAQPQYWLPEKVANQRVQDGVLWGFRRVARDTDERTVIASVLPTGAASNSWWVSQHSSSGEAGRLVAVFNSFAFDYFMRGSLSQPTIPLGVAQQCPVPDAKVITAAAWIIDPAVLELSFTAWDLDRFASGLGHHGPPFRWDEGRRARLRAELDALMFRLYGIQRDDVDYILDTFPIVKRKDEAAYGEYRTKRLILERYDEMAAAEAAGEEYQTVLDPPPADPSLCHPESTRPDWARPTP